MVVSMLTATTLSPGTWPDPDRVFAALADTTRRDIVWRAMTGDEGVVELSAHYPMSFAAVQKHIAVLERAGLVTKERIGRRKVVRSNVEAIRMAQRMLDRYEHLWRDRIDRMAVLLEEPIDAGSQTAASSQTAAGSQPTGVDQPHKETDR